MSVCRCVCALYVYVHVCECVCACVHCTIRVCVCTVRACVYMHLFVQSCQQISRYIYIADFRIAMYHDSCSCSSLYYYNIVYQSYLKKSSSLVY